MQRILFTLLAVFLLSACGGQKDVVKKYYMIEVPGLDTEPSKEAKPAIDAWCEVSEVEIYPAFDNREIVFRDDSHQIRYFGNHEWAVRPAEVLTPIITDYFSAQKIFTRVSTRFWERPPDYRLNATIFNLEVSRAERKKDFEAHLKLRFELIDTRTDTVAVWHTADRKSTLEERDLNLLASTISKMFHEELESFASKTKNVLSKQQNN
ncbi:MAG: ABC-type transport auxiliary lipoprotein family protein [Marinilabiliaceae bacterium]